MTQVSEESLRNILAEEWDRCRQPGGGQIRPHPTNPVRIHIGSGQDTMVPTGIALAAMRRVSTLQDQDGVIEAAKTASFHYWNCEDDCHESRPAMAALAMACGYTDPAVDDDIAAALKSPTPNGETP